MDLRSWIGGAAAIAEAATLLVGIVALAKRNDRARPWLAVLFGINSGYGGVSRDTLRGSPPVDLLMLLFAGATYAGFWPGPGPSHVVLMCLAIAQPLLGILLLIATRLVGRSGLMGGALVLSLLMLVGGTSAAAGGLGVTASLLLLVGDFGTSGRPSRMLAAFVLVGYAALIAWFVWLAVLLLA
jgi:hypothetical protein